MQRSPEDGNDLFITPEFPTAEQAGSFAHDPALRDGMYAAAGSTAAGKHDGTLRQPPAAKLRGLRGPPRPVGSA